MSVSDTILVAAAVWSQLSKGDLASSLFPDPSIFYLKPASCPFHKAAERVFLLPSLAILPPWVNRLQRHRLLDPIKRPGGPWDEVCFLWALLSIFFSLNIVELSRPFV